MPDPQTWNTPKPRQLWWAVVRADLIPKVGRVAWRAGWAADRQSLGPQSPGLKRAAIRLNYAPHAVK